MKKLLFISIVFLGSIQMAIAQSELSTLEVSPNLSQRSGLQDTLLPPTGLEAQVEGDDVLLNWLPPGDGPGQWFTYSDSITYTLIGLTDGGTFQAAARWDQEQLDGFDGEFLTKVEFIPGSESAGYILRIWRGAAADQLIYEQVIQQTDSLVWNEVILDEPVEIDASEELWVGFKINQLSMAFPMGVDPGPAVAGFGDLIQYDSTEWFTLTSLGLSHNWNIRAFLTLSGQSQERMVELGEQNQRNTNSFNLSGYNIYRDETKLNTTPIIELQYNDLDLSNGLYTYDVTAVYDTLESVPASIDVLIGGPELTITPDSLLLVGQSDSSFDTTISLINTGGDLLTWSASTGADWVSLDTAQGELLPGDTSSVKVTVDTEGLLAGDYSTLVEFTTNDINDPITPLFIFLDLSGTPTLTTSPDSLAFDVVVIGESASLQLMIMNTGTDDLIVTGIESSNNGFTINESEFFMNPGENVFVEVTFFPEAQGETAGELTIFSNDPENPEVIVSLSGTGSLPPPLNLQGSLQEQVVTLNWMDPTGGPGTWLFYGDGSVGSGIGLTEGGVWQIAARWEASQLADYAGEFLVKTQFYFLTGVAEYTLKVWEVDSLPVEIYSQYIGLVEDSLTWVEIFLDDPLLIDGETELFIGYEINQEINSFPAGVDFGPAIAGYGDLVSFNDNVWGNLSDFGLDFNWSIQAFVSSEQGPVLMPGFSKGQQSMSNQFLSLKSIEGNTTNQVAGVQELIGYNVYRDGVLLNDNTLVETTYQDTLSEAGTYSYTVTALYDEGESAPAGPVIISIDSLLLLAPAGWQLVESDVHHNIMIPSGISEHPENSLQPGDWAGTFFNHDDQMILAGMAMWDGTDVQMTVFGDHNLTPEKDGFIEGDSLIWKVYRQADQKEHLAIPVYNTEMPDADGTFRKDGTSGLEALKIEALSVEESPVFDAVVVYPIPAANEITLEHLPQNTNISLYGTDGRLILEDNQAGTTRKINVSGIKPGTYLLVMSSPEGNFFRTILIK